jgi:3-isopropylmalate/(R)-2-methylmalate dehydratase small subunit
MAALDMAVLCESMPHKSLRRAVAIGLPVLTGCTGAAAFVKSGDEIEVDFATGTARNLTAGTEKQFAPMPPILRDVVANGGSAGSMRAFLAAHPDLAVAPSVSAA